MGVRYFSTSSNIDHWLHSRFSYIAHLLRDPQEALFEYATNDRIGYDRIIDRARTHGCERLLRRK